MSTLIFGLLYCLIILLVILALWTNRQRRRTQKFELIPNCLLTRWPVLFVTGKRSLFYFSNYWNVYPEFLAEHGYEVFHLHLPWRNSWQRIKHLRHFLKMQAEAKAKFHFMLDENSYEELKHILINSPCVQSFQVVPKAVQKNPPPFLQALAYSLHSLLSRPTQVVPAADIGLSSQSLQNAVLLLEQVRVLAEADATGE